MKKRIIFSVICFAFVLVVLPASSEAYFTTAQSAEMLKDGKGIIYSVTYDFGMKNSDLYMPIIPERKGASSTAEQRTLTYGVMGTGTIKSQKVWSNIPSLFPKKNAMRKHRVFLYPGDSCQSPLKRKICGGIFPEGK
jgi:hypothetical protein